VVKPGRAVSQAGVGFRRGLGVWALGAGRSWARGRVMGPSASGMRHFPTRG